MPSVIRGLEDEIILRHEVVSQARHVIVFDLTRLSSSVYVNRVDCSDEWAHPLCPVQAGFLPPCQFDSAFALRPSALIFVTQLVSAEFY